VRPFSDALVLIHTRGLGSMCPYRLLVRARQLRWMADRGAALSKDTSALNADACSGPTGLPEAHRGRSLFQIQSFQQMGGEMTRHTVALLCLGLLTAWIDRQDEIVAPYNHPANPHARSAPPIPVPRIQAPNVEDVTPDPAREENSSPREQQRSSPGADAPTHQHQH